jgi:tetratricopeptide (TPR) repeat protein
MTTTMTTWWMCLVLATAGLAQGNGSAAEAGATGSGAAAEQRPVRAKVQISEGGRAALAAAKALAGRTRGLAGNERLAALQAAATAYDRALAEFGAEPAVAGAAAFAGAELWRQHGSLALAEKDFLLAAEIDGPRFGQRALLAAADLQRRLKRPEEAMVTFAKAATVEPGTARAQEARLGQARVLKAMGRLDEAITACQAALESAHPGKQTIDAADLLAQAHVQKGDLEAAERAIEHAEQVVGGVGDEDPIVVERLRKALTAMSARKLLQRARDKAAGAGADAVRLDSDRAGR